MKISEYLDNFKKILIQNEQKLFYSLIFFGLILRLVNLFNSAISADSLDYINIGKNIRENQSFSLDYRFFFFDGNFSTYHDSFQRAPLYSLLISPIASFSNIRLISFLNVIFFYSFLYIFYDLVCSNFDKRVAQLSCIALSIHPLFVEITSIPSSEPLFMLLVVLSLRNINSHNPRDVILHSIFVGLAYLTRPLALTVLVSSLLIKSINRQYRESSYTLFFFFLTISPWMIRNYLLFEDPFYSSYNYQNKFPSYDEFFYYYSGPIASISVFEKISLIIHTSWDYVKIIPNSAGLSVILPFSIISIFSYLLSTQFRLKNNHKYYFILIALLNFTLISLIWSTTRGGRFLLITYIFMLPFAFSGLLSSSFSKDKINNFSSKILIILVCFMLWSVNSSRDSLNEDTFGSEISQEIILSNMDSDSKIISDRPGLIYYKTGLESYHLKDFNDNDFADFVNKTEVSYIILVDCPCDGNSFSNKIIDDNKSDTFYSFNLIYSDQEISIYRIQ